MSIQFARNDDIPKNSFCAAFVHQDYYVELLRLCDVNFGLHLLSRERREIPLRDSAYMLISTDPTTIKEINVGVKVTMKVTELVYSKPLKLLVAKVFLKRNFTSAKIPHIIVAKDPLMPNQTAIGLLNGTFDHMGDTYRIPLYEQFEIKARVGIMSGSDQESYTYSLSESIDDEGENIEVKKPVAPPERRQKTTQPSHAHQPHQPAHQPSHPPQHPRQDIPKSQPQKAKIEPPPISSSLSRFFMTSPGVIEDLKASTFDNCTNVTVQKTKSVVERPEATEVVEKVPNGVMKINLSDIVAPQPHPQPQQETNAPSTESASTAEEQYKGMAVFKGPRGGKYVVKNGKKIYLKEGETGGDGGKGPLFKSGVVYKVNVLRKNGKNDDNHDD